MGEQLQSLQDSNSALSGKLQELQASYGAFQNQPHTAALPSVNNVAVFLHCAQLFWQCHG